MEALRERTAATGDRIDVSEDIATEVRIVFSMVLTVLYGVRCVQFSNRGDLYLSRNGYRKSSTREQS